MVRACQIWAFGSRPDGGFVPFQGITACLRQGVARGLNPVVFELADARWGAIGFSRSLFPRPAQARTCVVSFGGRRPSRLGRAQCRRWPVRGCGASCAVWASAVSFRWGASVVEAWGGARFVCARASRAGVLQPARSPTGRCLVPPKGNTGATQRVHIGRGCRRGH